MTGGRRYGFGGKEDIGGGFFGFCLSFGRRRVYCPVCLLELGIIGQGGSFGAIKASLIVDESRMWLNRVKTARY